MSSGQARLLAGREFWNSGPLTLRGGAAGAGGGQSGRQARLLPAEAPTSQASPQGPWSTGARPMPRSRGSGTRLGLPGTEGHPPPPGLWAPLLHEHWWET